MFRKMALKKGHLKPIHAQTGIMVGQPYSGAPVPAIRKPPSFMERMSVSGPARFLRQGVSIPTVGGYVAGEKVADAFGVQDPVGRTAFGLGGSYLATKALPGLASLPAATSLALMAGPAYLTYAGSKELERIKKMTPEQRAAHAEKSKQFGMSYLDDDQFNQQFTPRLNEIVSNEEIKDEVKVSSKPRPNNPRGMGNKNQNDRLTETQNESEVVKGSVDVNKVVQNNDPNLSAPLIGVKEEVKVADKKGPEGDKTTVTETETITNDEANKKVIASGKETLETPGKIKASDGTEVNTEVIDLAKAYRTELMAGQKSQAKLVFLANLASGLLSGKTQKGGLSGALEVFGSALGPAVNNYATIKLKENELSNEFMSDALELAQDEIDRRNTVLEAPDAPERTPGVVQIIGRDGQPINVVAGRLKDGTVQMAIPGPDGIGPDGRQMFTTLAPGEYVRFAPNSALDKPALELLSDLSSKYKALALGQKSIRILDEFKASGTTGAGPVGRFNLFKSRLGDAMYDLTGMNMFTNTDEAKAKANEYRDLLIDDWMKSNDVDDREAAGKEIDRLLGDSVNQNKIMNAIADATGEKDKQNLSQLAINETVMVYALANSLKSKDRLTARDIEMAKDLVNIFPLLRGQESVIRDLRSVNNTILEDINSLEQNYLDGLLGDSYTINNYRRRYGITGIQEGLPQPLENPFKDLTNEQLLEGFGTL